MPSRLAPIPPSVVDTSPTTGDRLSAAASRIRRVWSESPAVGLVLGSGLHRLAEAIDVDVAIDFDKLPGLLAPTATGHRGRVLCGWLAGLPIVACQGRLHAYEGRSQTQLRFPVRLFAELGCETLILSNAAGGVNPDYRVGDIMIVTDHLDLVTGSPLNTLAAFPEATSSSCYDAKLAQVAYDGGRAAGRPVHCGTYAAMTGPNYETRAEYRMLRAIGVDTVGMSTVPEAIEGSARGLRVLALSTVTNACDPDALTETTGEAVIEAAEAAEAHVRGIVWDVLSTMAAS